MTPEQEYRLRLTNYAVNDLETLAKQTTPEAALESVLTQWAIQYPDRAWFVNTTQEAMKEWGKSNGRKLWNR